METMTKVAVVGAGAIGGITAGFVARAGCDVELVCKYPDLAERIRETGIQISGVKGNHRIRMPAVEKIARLSGEKDIVFLATKATDMMAAAEDLLPFLHSESVVVSMQNGICEDDLAKVFGRRRTIGCVVGWGATMLRPGELEMTSTGDFYIGNIDHETDPRLETIARILDHVLPVTISANIMGYLYAKLIINACINSMGAITGLYLGHMLGIRKIRRVFIGIFRETMALAEAMGIDVEVYGGKLDYRVFLKGSGMVQDFKRHLLLRLIGFKYRRLKSSTLQSLERGKPSEIDYLNGYISANGKKNGVATPICDRIVGMVKEIETGERQIGLVNLADPVFSVFD